MSNEPTWFKRVFGFTESKHEGRVQKRFQVVLSEKLDDELSLCTSATPVVLRSRGAPKALGTFSRKFHVGPFECVSGLELDRRRRVRRIALGLRRRRSSGARPMSPNSSQTSPSSSPSSSPMPPNAAKEPGAKRLGGATYVIRCQQCSWFDRRNFSFVKRRKGAQPMHEKRKT